MWNRMVIASGEPDSEALIIKPEEADQMAQMGKVMQMLQAAGGKPGKAGKDGSSPPAIGNGGGATQHEKQTMMNEGPI